MFMYIRYGKKEVEYYRVGFHEGKLVCDQQCRLLRAETPPFCA